MKSYAMKREVVRRRRTGDWMGSRSYRLEGCCSLVSTRLCTSAGLRSARRDVGVVRLLSVSHRGVGRVKVLGKGEKVDSGEETVSQVSLELGIVMVVDRVEWLGDKLAMVRLATEQRCVSGSSGQDAETVKGLARRFILR